MSCVLIKGKIVFQGDVLDISGASVKIEIHDVSRADAKSVTVSTFQIHKLSKHSSTANSIPFELSVDFIPRKVNYSIWAHIDVDRDNQISKGDFITMQSYPIKPQNVHEPFIVTVRQVN